MPEVRAEVTIELEPARAQALWTDPQRWASFIDGFGRVLEVDPAWPQPESKAIWESKPNGRGRVTERMRQNGDGIVVTAVYEDQLTGVQTARFEDGRMLATLEYELTSASRITDFLFIRRLLRQSVERTLARFAIEAADEASL